MEEIVEGRSEGAIKGRYYGKLHKIIESSFQEENFWLVAMYYLRL